MRTGELILVTGGAGYLGSLLIRLLLQHGYRVRVLDKLQYGNAGVKDLHDRDFEFMHGDTRHIEDVVTAMQDVDAVIHLAGMVGDEVCAMNPNYTIGQNYFSAHTVAFIAKYYHVPRFILASSASVYGQTNSDVPLDEESATNPLSMYASDKLLTEQTLLAMANNDFTVTALRMGTLYGLSQRMRFDLVVNLLTAMGTIHKEFTIFGGEQSRPLLHVYDAAQAYLCVLEADKQKVNKKIFNAASKNMTVADLGVLVQLTLVGECKVEQMTILKSAEITDNRSYSIDSSRLRAYTGWKPEKTIVDGIKAMHTALTDGRIKNFRLPIYTNKAMHHV